MRIVVVGAGMVGHRFADEVIRLDPSVEVQLLGEEAHEPYNRVLLTELLAGRVDAAGLALPPAGDGVRVRLGEPVLDIDRAGHIVRTGATEIGYDHLVLAIGSRALVPAVPGLLDGLPGGVFALRSLDDARRVGSALTTARRVVVVGGGPLGVEAACALRRQGARVTIVSGAAGLLDRDLDAGVTDVVVQAAADLGIEFRGGARLSSVEVEDGHVRGVGLADGASCAADLLLLACGAAAETTLAETAGLAIGRGIVVDRHLRTDDPSISAIGDCAETPAGLSGLVAPGWAQARALARLLVRGAVDPLPEVTGAAMRLKAVGLSVVTMGRRASTAHGDDRVVRLDDRGARRLVELVVHDGTLVGLTCVGAAELAAQLSTQFERPGIMPADPLQLLLGDGGRSESASPTTMPSATTVCRCNGVTKGDLVHAWEAGATSVDSLVESTLATTGCGGCRSLVCGIAEWLEQSDPRESSQSPTNTRESSVLVG